MCSFEVAGAVESLLARADELPDSEVQRLFTAAFKLYAARATSERLAPFDDADAVTATEVVTVASALLQAHNLEVFELALWQNWGSSPLGRQPQ